MTLDITIGKLKILTFKEWCENYSDPEFKKGCINYFSDFLEVVSCPESENNICNPEQTIYPKRSRRSGNNINVRNFLFKYLYSIMINWKPVGSNDRQIGLIKPYINVINSINDPEANDLNKDRIKWFKYWCNKAVKLYGDEAAISFS